MMFSTVIAVVIGISFAVPQDTSKLDFDDDNVDVSVHSDSSTEGAHVDGVPSLNSPQRHPGATAIETRSCYLEGGELLSLALCSLTEGWSNHLGCKEGQSVALPYGVRDPSDEATEEEARWQSTGTPHCADPAQTQELQLHEVVEQEFATLPITPSPLAVQPVNGWTFVNVPTIVYTDAARQTLTTVLLGIAIEVEVTPTSFTWDFDDAHAPEPLATTDPGAPYPDHTIEHTYTRIGKATITLATTWTGRFRTSNSAEWTPINGTATTTSTAPNLEIREATSRLVEDPLN